MVGTLASIITKPLELPLLTTIEFGVSEYQVAPPFWVACAASGGVPRLLSG